MWEVYVINTLHWGAVTGALCSAIGFLRAELYWIAGLEVLCAAGLGFGLVWKSVRLTRLAQLLLLLQTIVLGAVWPSAITIVALLVLPGIVLVVRELFRTPLPGSWLVYIYSSALVAALSLAAEGWLLATISRG